MNAGNSSKRTLSVDDILEAFEEFDSETRRAFVCSFAHQLTVTIRTLIFDRPVADADLDRIQNLNEALHQLSSCANPHKHWSLADERLMLRAILDSSLDHGLEHSVTHALAIAAGGVLRLENALIAK